MIGVALLWNAWATRERGDALPVALGFAVAEISVMVAMEGVFQLAA